MLRKIVNYFNLQHAGGVELYFSTLLILSAYSFHGIPLQVVLWTGLFIILFIKRNPKRQHSYRPLVALVVFVVFHDFLYLFIAKGNINAFIMQIFYFGCTLMAAKVFDITKLKGALNLVAIISIIGLIYQWGTIAAGGVVHPIRIPLLDMDGSRLEMLSVRPSSFFMEPAAYVAFMYLPLAFSLMDRKFIWTAIIILSQFLTTSTTGLLTSFIMLIAYLFTQRVSFRTRLLTIVIGVFMLWTLTSFEAFQTSVDKLESTDVERNMRLVQGPYIVGTMRPIELFFGAPYHNAYDYCLAGRATDVVFYNEEVYMSTIWMIILKYGFVGLFLYLFFYYRLAKHNRELVPLIVCLFVTMFSSGYGIGINFVYTSVGLLLVYYNKSVKAGI